MNDLTKKTMLVVEDEPSLREAIVFKFRKDGVNVWEASTAEDALKIVENQGAPDLMWLDILLPGMNGLDLLEKFRGMANMKDTPVLIVSASQGEDKIKKAEQLKITEYIVKSNMALEDIIKKAEVILKQ